MAIPSITPQRGPQNIAYEQSKQQMPSGWAYLADRERQRKDAKKIDFDKILGYAGTALDLYGKYQASKSAAIQQRSAEIDQGLKTLHGIQALTQLSTQAQELKDKVEVGENISQYINAEDPQGLYRYMLGNVSRLSSNPQLMQAGVEYLKLKGFSEEETNMFLGTGVTPAQMFGARARQGQLDLGQQRVDIQRQKLDNTLTQEQKENQKKAAKTYKDGPEALSTALLSNPDNDKLSVIMDSINVDSSNPKELDKFFTQDYDCKVIPNWTEEIEKLNSGEITEAYGMNSDELMSMIPVNIKDPLKDSGKPAHERAGIQGIIQCIAKDPTSDAPIIHFPVRDKAAMKAFSISIGRAKALKDLGLGQDDVREDVTAGLEEYVKKAATPHETAATERKKPLSKLTNNIASKYNSMEVDMDHNTSMTMLEASIEEDINKIKTTSKQDYDALVLDALQLVLNNSSDKETEQLQAKYQSLTDEDYDAIITILFRNLAMSENNSTAMKDSLDDIRSFVLRTGAAKQAK